MMSTFAVFYVLRGGYVIEPKAEKSDIPDIEAAGGVADHSQQQLAENLITIHGFCMGEHVSNRETMLMFPPPPKKINAIHREVDILRPILEENGNQEAPGALRNLETFVNFLQTLYVSGFGVFGLDFD
ncbi:hypothetical protein CRG98_002163 [Punica granatum]|uniref:Uncharacterized protein n=1 Tax=Punica granatum TaxID=22663 RepID=A0A2I0LA47_PUNGR|nr:hypothetical protein CRG98_002163 [Punica granatum]